jgi:cytochrome c-type biogenesis protein CcmF
VVALVVGCRSNTVVAFVIGLMSLVASATIASLLHDVSRRAAPRLWLAVSKTATSARRQYAGYVVHLGLALVAMGIAGSTLGTQRADFVMGPGETVSWAGRNIRLGALEQQVLADKLIAEAVLEVSQGDEAPAVVRPARHWHRLQNEWSTAVAIHSTWRADFYVILHGGAHGKADMTFVENPLMRFLWLGGSCAIAGAFVAVWPARKRGMYAGGTHGVDHPSREMSPIHREERRAA